MNSRGLAPIFIIILIAVSLGGYLVYKQTSQSISKTQSIPLPTTLPTSTSSASITPQPKQVFKPAVTFVPQLSPTPSPAALNDLGFKLDFISNPDGSDGVDILIEAGRSMKVFTIQAARDESYTLLGNPIEGVSGIEWSTTTGSLSKGGNQEINIKISSELYSKEYTGTGIIQNSKGIQQRFPLKIAVYNPVKGTGESKIITSISGSPFIKITSPNGGEAFTAGSGLEVRWDANSPGNCNVYVKDTSNSLIKISNGVVSASLKMLWWSSAGINSASTEDRVKAYISCTDGQGRSFEDESDNYFTIKK